MHQPSRSALSPNLRLPFSCHSGSSSSSSNTSNYSLNNNNNNNNDPNSLPTNALQERMKSLAEKADAYLRSCGYEVNQRNGQRISVRVNQESEENEQWQSEVFVGKIPRELFEDHLLPFMEQAGPVKQIRLMMDFSGTNRGFAFVKFLHSADAAFACAHLSGQLLTPDAEFPIGVKPSFDNKILFFGRLPLKLTRERLLKELNRVLDGVADAKLFDPPTRPHSATNQPLNKKYRHAFVSFKTHDHATQARRILLPGIVKVFDRVITVDWAMPEAPAMNQSNILNSRRLRPNTSLINNSNNNNRLTSQTSPSPAESILAPISPDIPPIDISPPIESSFLYNPIQTWEDIFSPSESILGEKAKEILELTMPDHSRIITVCNIKTDSIDLRKLKHIFELNGHLQIVKIMPSGVESLTIEYATSNQATLMLEALLLMSSCFDKLAVQNQVLLAFQGTMADVNANYQLPLAYYTKQPLISQ